MPNRYLIAFTAAFGLIMSVLDNTIVNVAVVPIAEALGSDLSTIQWIVTGYFLAQAAVIPVAGYFSARYGSKRVFVLSLVLFTLGSVACGLAQNEAQLILFRMLQGIGGGALFPISQAIAFQAFPPEQRNAATAIVAVPTLLAPAFGPTLGGLLTVLAGWSWIFFINVPLGVISIAMAIRNLPDDRPTRQPGGFDVVGLVLSIVGVVALVYGFALVSETIPGTATAANPRGTLYGWTDPQVIAWMTGGLVTLALFAFYELRVSRDPVLDLRVLGERAFLVSGLATWIFASVIFGSLLILTIFLQQVRLPNLSPLDAGLVLMPQGLAASATVALSNRFYNRIGVRHLVILGALLLLIPSLALSRLAPDESLWYVVPWLALRGVGFGLTFIPLQTVAIQRFSGADLAKASSLFNVTRQIFSSLGIAITVTVFVQRSATYAADFGRLDGPTNVLARAGSLAAGDVFLLSAVGSFLIFVLAFFLPRQKDLPG